MFFVPDDHDVVALVNRGHADATALDQAGHALGELLLEHLPIKKIIFNWV